MKCPICKKDYPDLEEHLESHGYTKEEAKNMVKRINEFGDD